MGEKNTVFYAVTYLHYSLVMAIFSPPPIPLNFTSDFTLWLLGESSLITPQFLTMTVICEEKDSRDDR